MNKVRFMMTAVLFLMSGVAALIGMGNSYPSFITPRSSNGQLKNISGDGWVVNGSAIVFAGLAERGNHLEVSLNNWRPSPQPAHMKLYVCEKQVAELHVVEPTRFRIPLRGECEPREIRFEVLNPVQASESDRRQLGVQLNSVQIISRFGLPIMNLTQLILAGAGIAFLSFTAFLALSRFSAGYVALLVPVSFGLLLSISTYPHYSKVLALGICASAFLTGLVLAAGVANKELIKAEERIEVSNLWGRSLAAAIVLIAIAFRFYGLDFGLPNNYHPDEVPKVNAIMRMVDNGNLNPQYFLHPSLLLYSTYLTNTIFHWFGIEGTFRETAFLAGRTVSAIAGSLSVYFLYVIGSRLYSRFAGLLAAAALAVFPLHVTCSRYLKEDALLLCLVLACIVALLKAVYEDRKGFIFLAAFLAGASASAKYSGLLTFTIVCAGPWLKTRTFKPDLSFAKVTAVSLLVVPLGFLLFTPYSILDNAKFLRDFGSEKRHMLRGHTIPIDAWSQYWMYHFSRSIVPGMSMWSALVGVAGLGFLVWRRRIEDLFVVGLVLLYYMPAEWVKAKPAPQPERYILPCLPFLALAGAEMLRYLWQRRWALNRLAPVVMLLSIVMPAKSSLDLATEIEYDTRTQMADWMRENLEPGAKIYLDWKPYAPRFWNNEFSITYVPRFTILKMLDVKSLKQSGQDYLVLSSLFYDRYFSQPDSEAPIRQRFREVFERVPIVKQITPRHGTYGFHNPTLTIFSLKEQDFARLEQELQAKKNGEIEQTTNEIRASINWANKNIQR